MSRPKRSSLRDRGMSRSEGWTLAAREEGMEDMSSSLSLWGMVGGGTGGRGGGRSKVAMGLTPNNV